MQTRQLARCTAIRKRMHSASPQQWNIIELLYLCGDLMPLHGKWREQRAVRSLIRRGVIIGEQRDKRITHVSFTLDAAQAIRRYEAGILQDTAEAIKLVS